MSIRSFLAKFDIAVYMVYVHKYGFDRVIKSKWQKWRHIPVRFHYISHAENRTPDQFT